MNLQTVKSVLVPEGAVVKILSGTTLIWKKKLSILPDEYQQVSYLETDGNQYIDTGVVASHYPDGIQYYVHGHLLGYKNTSTNNYLLGALANGSRSGNVSLRPAVVIVFAGGTSDNILTHQPIAANTDFELQVTATSKSLDKVRARLNGSEFQVSSGFSGRDMPAANIYLMHCNGVSASNGKYWGRIYRVTMWDSDEALVRDFVPCYRKADGVLGLYDLVSGTLFTNQGTGTFSKGNDV